jgi:4-amino-4-deoxy-L-arabinose transferase-like glycosyltransferase
VAKRKGRIPAPQPEIRQKNAPWKELGYLSLLTLVLLVPFIGKPLHVDDPLYVWTAKHIVEHSVDFYGFNVNWIGITESMAVANKNPPGASYWLALFGALFGWSEPALHAGMLVPAVLAVVGVFLLARSLGAPPILASLSLVAMPGFLVSSTTLMADVLATALWTWAVLAWVVGLQERRSGWLAAGALLAGLCILTKYVGVALIPLLLAYTLTKCRRLKVQSLLLLIPVAIVLAYRARMISRYGVDPLTGVSSFSLRERQSLTPNTNEAPWIGLSFLGGTCLPALFLTPWTFGRRGSALTVVLILLVFGALLGMKTLGHTPLHTSEGPRWGLVLQFALFTVSGALIFALVLRHVVRSRGAEAILLALWLCGIFVFGSLVNWTTNVRALLPAAPAVAILLAFEARRVGRHRPFRIPPGLLATLGIGAVAGLVVAQGDQAFARSARDAAREIVRERGRAGQPLWYQGSWGFQYYMDLEGAKRIDWRDIEVIPGDELVESYSNSGVYVLPRNVLHPVRLYRIAVPALASTLSGEVGAGFYSDSFGPLPYLFGFPPEQLYSVLLVQARLFIGDDGWIHPNRPSPEVPP